MDRLACDRMFIAVLETGSFTAAAARFGTNSGQASKLVSRLEAELGVRLLNRTTRAVAATEVGQAYFEQIRNLIDEIDSLDQSVRDTAQNPKGRIRMTVPVTFGAMILTPLLAQFAGAQPGITLDVAFSDRVTNLVDEGFDFALRISARPDSNLVMRKLCDVRITTSVSQAYTDAYGLPDRPQDLTGHDCILDSNQTDPHSWRYRDIDGQAITVPVSGRMKLSNAEACILAAEAGLGVANGPSFAAGPPIVAGRLFPILAAFEPPPIELMALYPTGRHLATKVRVLLDFLVETFRGTPPWERGWPT